MGKQGRAFISAKYYDVCMQLDSKKAQKDAFEAQLTWMMISSSMRSVQLILSMIWSEPLYSITAFPTFISLLNMLTTNSPLNRNSPRLFEMAAGRQKTEQGYPRLRLHDNDRRLSRLLFKVAVTGRLGTLWLVFVSYSKAQAVGSSKCL